MHFLMTLLILNCSILCYAEEVDSEVVLVEEDEVSREKVSEDCGCGKNKDRKPKP